MKTLTHKTLTPFSVVAACAALASVSVHADSSEQQATVSASTLALSDGLAVDLDDSLADTDILALQKNVEAMGASWQMTGGSLTAGNRYEVRGDTATLLRVAAFLQQQDGVESAEPNFIYTLDDANLNDATALQNVATSAVDEKLIASDNELGGKAPNDPMYKSQWHFGMVNAERAWEKADGAGVIVAVIDTGVSPGKIGEKASKYKRVPDLKETGFVAGYNFVENNNDPSDGNGHGTHVAGTIAQSTNNNFGVAGLAPKAQIMPIKVLSDRGSGTVNDIAAGIHYAADHGAKVINMSLGGGMYSATLARAVKYAFDKGVFVACAAGNGGRAKVEYPAAYDGCTAVSALGPDGTLAFYSSHGKETDIAAPGGDTRVDLNGDGLPDGVLQNTIGRGDPTQHGFFPFQGTSMATPHVAGAAALVMGMGVTNPKAVEKKLQETAKKLNDPIKYGAGGLDAGAAVESIQKEQTLWPAGIAGLLAVSLLGAARRRRVALGYSFAGVAMLTAMGLSSALGTSAMMAVTSVGGFVAMSAVWALIPVFTVGNQKVRTNIVTGFAIGVAAFLGLQAYVGSVDVVGIQGTGFLDSAWLLANAVVAYGAARLALRR